MMKRSRDQQELVIRRLLDRLAAESADPTEAELSRAARLASAEGRSPQERPAERIRPWRPLRLRWAAASAGAVLVATALGFGAASWLTPAGSARTGTDVEGLGFLPAKGWTVIQTGLAGPAESARAVAANVRLEAPNPEVGFPLPALGNWPPWGIVIVATLRARGDPAVDARFPVRSLPLRLADAVPVSETEHVLRSGVGGYNVEASIGFGGEPTAEMLQNAEDQIARLVVAPAQVTMGVRPLINPRIVFGSVASGREGERVTVQFKQCGLLPVQFRDLVEATTVEGGGWSVDLGGVPTNGVLRAVLSDAMSNEVRVQQRVDVRLAPHGSRKYEVNVVSHMSFWKKRVLLQRFDRGRNVWVTVRALVLENTFGPGLIWSTTDRFTVKLPKGTTIRAVLPLSQAKPCYLAGYSNLLRT